MGNSKALMLGAVSLIIGMYTLKIKEADRTVSEIGTTRYAEVQALEMAKTGVIVAEEEATATDDGFDGSRQKSLTGGSITYTVKKLAGHQVRITSTAIVSGQTRSVVTILSRTAFGEYFSNSKKYFWSRWATTKTYVQP